MDALEKKALREKLNALVGLKGVIAAYKYEVTPAEEFRLPREVASAKPVFSGDFDWWVMNLCEVSLALVQAETLDYDNLTQTRSYFPPAAIFIRGKEWSLLGAANRVVALLRNSERPNLWEVLAQVKTL